MVRYGKHSVAPLDLDGTAVVLHKLHHLPGVKSINSAVQKLGVGYNMSPEFLYVAGICQVAAPFSGDIDLLAGLLCLFQNSNRPILFA